MKCLRFSGVFINQSANLHLPSPVPIRIICFCFSAGLLVGWWGWLAVEAQEFVQAFAGAGFGGREDVANYVLHIESVLESLFHLLHQVS